MARRWTIAEKWQENKKFRSFSAQGKLLYFYLYDNCNCAGIWLIDLEDAAYDLKLNPEIVEQAFAEINDSYLTNGEYIILKDFLAEQRNLPLRPDSVNAHKGIVAKLCEHPDLYEAVKKNCEIMGYGTHQDGLFNPSMMGTGKGKGNGKGNKGGMGGNHKCFRLGCTETAVWWVLDDTGLKYYICYRHLTNDQRADFMGKKGELTKLF